MDRLRDLYWRLRHEWRLHYLLPCLLMLPVIVLLSKNPFETDVERGEPVTARITSLGVGWNKYQGATPGLQVIARSADGAVGSTIALPASVAGCEVGDPIPAERKGIKLYLHPKACSENGRRTKTGEIAT